MNSVKKIVIKNYKFVCDNVPDEFCGAKIAFLTDIHHGRCFSSENLRELVKMTNELSPDIILLGGDYVDKDPARIKSFFDIAKDFSAPLGAFAVLGNHDRWVSERLSEKYLDESGITALDNHAVFVRRGKARIRIGGVGDMKTTSQDLRPMLNGTRADDLMILVTHNPDYVKKLPKNRIDLMLCGHTHGGQISFRGKWAPTVFHGIDLRYLTGVVKKDTTTVIVSNGIGTVGIPLRICAHAQLWLIELQNH